MPSRSELQLFVRNYLFSNTPQLHALSDLSVVRLARARCALITALPLFGHARLPQKCRELLHPEQRLPICLLHPASASYLVPPTRWALYSRCPSPESIFPDLRRAQKAGSCTEAACPIAIVCPSLRCSQLGREARSGKAREEECDQDLVSPSGGCRGPEVKRRTREREGKQALRRP
jgi:hypothetical protein